MTGRAYDFQRYLAAKKTVDDRALHQGVWDRMSDEVKGLPSEKPVMILEIGAGIGTMVDRLLERNAVQWFHYHGVDSVQENIQTATQRLPEVCAALGWELNVAYTPITPISQMENWSEPLHLVRDGHDCQVTFEAANFESICDRAELAGHFDLLIAQAFLDLVEISQALPRLFKLLKPGGYFYFTINFDGETIFEPEIDPAFETEIMRLYHQSMDERLADGRPGGDSHAGRHLFTHLPAAGGTILAAGASDWVVYPDVSTQQVSTQHVSTQPTGEYLGDEAYFLHHILSFFEDTLGASPELNQEKFTKWLAVRREQIQRAELIFIAHQLDFFGKVNV